MTQSQSTPHLLKSYSTLKEAARYFGISYWTMMDWIRERRIAVLQSRKYGDYRISRKAIQDFEKAHTLLAK